MVDASTGAPHLNVAAALVARGQRFTDVNEAVGVSILQRLCGRQRAGSGGASSSASGGGGGGGVEGTEAPRLESLPDGARQGVEWWTMWLAGGYFSTMHVLCWAP